jgi:hypothetical protein
MTITSLHALVYSDDPEATRAFLRDVLEWPYVEHADLEPGWLIFKSGPSGSPSRRRRVSSSRARSRISVSVSVSRSTYPGAGEVFLYNRGTRPHTTSERRDDRKP